MQLKNIISLFTILSLLSLSLTEDSEASPLPFVLEAEDSTYKGQILTSDEDGKIQGEFSGKGFIYITTKKFTFTFTAAEEGMFHITARIAQVADKNGISQMFAINGVKYTYTAPYYDTWTDLKIGNFRFSKGVNTLIFLPNKGNVYFDKITITEPIYPEFSLVDTTLTDPKATPQAQKVMDYLGSVYGKKIISGQQETYGGGNDGNYELEFDFIYEKTGKYPAIRGFDFMNYNPLYGWDDQTTERVIEWVNGRGGIATASWHINIPIDFDSYTVGDRLDWTKCTYATSSTFKTENTVVEGTKENDYFNAAIKLLAEQFLRLQDKNVPLIFRPLHEAEGNANTDGSGSWFWWGKKGAKVYVEIWKYLYTKLTQEYGVHNLIWEQNLYAWNADSLQWYSGDEWVDMVGYDKYNTVYNRHDGKTFGPNLDAESAIFYTLVNFVDNKKLVAMAENDSIPGLDNLLIERSAWLYFCPWYGEHILDSEKNDPEDLKTIYQSDYCVTLDELPNLSVS